MRNNSFWEPPYKMPEYFFLEMPDRWYRIRVPWIATKVVINIIEDTHGNRNREHPISWNHIPGPTINRLVSSIAAERLIAIAQDEGWFE